MGPVWLETSYLVISPLHEGCAQHVAEKDLTKELEDKSSAVMKFDFSRLGNLGHELLGRSVQFCNSKKNSYS